MLERAIAALNPVPGSLLLIENVDNLVCPALFDLGEAAIALASRNRQRSQRRLLFVK